MFLVSRRHHDAVVREKDRQIEILAEQIDWLRMYVGKPSVGQPVNPTEQPPMVEGMPWMSEEEEDLIHLRQTGQLSDIELERALAEVGFQNTTIESLT